MLNKKHLRLFASIFVLAGILLFVTAPVLSVSAALPILQDDPEQEPPQDLPEQQDPPLDDDPDVIVPETGEQQQTVDASWIIWLVIGIVIIILLVALLARGRGPRI